MNIQKNRLELTTTSGVRLLSIDSVPRFSKQIRYVFQGDEVRFVDEMPVAQYKSVKNGSSLDWRLGVKEDCLGRPLIVHEGLVARGLGMHSSSQVAYRWDGSAATFRAELRFAKAPEGANKRIGNVRCKLLLARDGRIETAAELELDRERHPSDKIDVDVSGAKLVVLVTEENQWSQWGDHILWLDARLVPSSE